MSLESRSFLHRVNDQVRKRQKQSSKDAAKDSDKHSVHTWWVELSSPLVQHQSIQFCQLPENDVERMQQGTGEERVVAKSKPTLNLVSHSAANSSTTPSSIVSKSSGDTESTQSARFESHGIKCRETCRWRFKSKWRSVEFSSVANRCKKERQCEETRCRNEPGSEFSRMCKDTCRRKFRNQRRGRFELAAQLPHISCWRSTPRESLFELATTTETKARRQNGRPRCEYVEMVNV